MTRYVTPCAPPGAAGWYLRLWPHDSVQPVVLRLTEAAMVSYGDETTRLPWNRLPDGALVLGPLVPAEELSQAETLSRQQRWDS